MADIQPDRIAASIEEARANGLPFFLRSDPCRNGHAGPFRVINYACIECERASLRRRRESARQASAPTPKAVAAKSLAEAIASGAKRYSTGLPCKRGHIAERMVAGRMCVECDRLRKVGDPAVLERQRGYFARNRERLVEQAREYRARKSPEIKAQRKAYREANKDRINAHVAAWAKANPEKRRAKERAREGRERGAEGTHTYADIQVIGERQGWKCAAPWCPVDIRAGFHVDHVQPIVRGGSNWPSNLQLLCAACNQSKADRDPIEWAAAHGAERKATGHQD